MLHDAPELFPIVEGCKSCFMCRFICTSARTLNTEKDTPRGRSLLLSMIRRGTLSYNADVADAIFSCCLCAHCRASCASHFDFPAVAVAARTDMVQAGLLPKVLAPVRQSLAAHDNPYGVSALDPALASAIADLPRTADTLLLLGPDARFRRPSAALAAIAVFKKLGLSCTCLEREPSSVYLLHELGAEEESGRKREELAKAIKASGAARVICLDPRAYHRMGQEAGPARKMHFIELAAEYAGRLKPASGKSFSYHEPDYLVRWSDLREAADTLLRALGDYKPPYWRGVEAKSLGGILSALYRPDFADMLAVARIEDFTELGVTTILAATGDDLAALEGPATARGMVCEHIAEAVAAAL